jgi:hypothetical protein
MTSPIDYKFIKNVIGIVNLGYSTKGRIKIDSQYFIIAILN